MHRPMQQKRNRRLPLVPQAALVVAAAAAEPVVLFKVLRLERSARLAMDRLVCLRNRLVVVVEPEAQSRIQLKRQVMFRLRHLRRLEWAELVVREVTVGT